jgi:hypothetical protein
MLSINGLLRFTTQWHARRPKSTIVRRRSKEPPLMKIASTAPGALLLGLLSVPAFADYASDRAEIENLAARYMLAVDAGDIDTVMSAWTDDGVLHWGNGTERGAAAIRAAMSNFGGAKAIRELPKEATTRPRQHHHITNHVIDVKGDTAKSAVYWFAITNNTPQKEAQLFYFGHYEDELVKRDGRWLFKVRRVYNEALSNRALFYTSLGEKDSRPAAEGSSGQ